MSNTRNFQNEFNPQQLKRCGNDEIPATRSAVNIIRKVSPKKNSTVNLKQINNPSTKTAKLIYKTKKSPAKIKSIHTYKVDYLNTKNIEEKNTISMNPFQLKENNTNIKTNEKLKSKDGKNFVESLMKDNSKQNFQEKRFELQTEMAEIGELLNEIKNKNTKTPNSLAVNSLNEFKKEENDTKFVNKLSSSKKSLLSKKTILNTPKTNEIIKKIPQSSRQIKSTTKISKICRRSKSAPNLNNSIENNENTKTSHLLKKDKKISKTPLSKFNSINNNNNNKENKTPSTQNEIKTKKYNPEVARRFIKEQQLKRKLEANEQKENQEKDKREEIKKRLEILKKNSLKILENNVKNSKKKLPQTIEKNLTKEKLKTPISAKSKISTSIKTLKSIEKTRMMDENKNDKPKKIGLLRELYDFKSIDNCENISFNSKQSKYLNRIDKLTPTPYLLDDKNKENSIDKNINNELNYKNQTEEFIIKKPLIESNKNSIDKQKIIDSKTIKFDTENKNLPYWLKPSTVQIYPYNFIMAVRKKLEAITNPIQKTNTKNIVNNNNNNIKYDQKIKNNKQNEEIKSNEKNDKLIKSDNNDNNHNNSKSLSEITSNFSSISIQIPNSQTISEISSINSAKIQSIPIVCSTKINNNKNSKIINNNDDTTISSSVFSSPEKKTKIKQNQLILNDIKQLSPLSTENIDNINLLTNLNINENNINNNLDEISKKNQLNDNNNQTTTTTNLKKLFNDFNKSLTQVIEVNDKIKETFSKSQNLISTQQSIKIDENSKNLSNKSKNNPSYYTSDFDNGSTSKSSFNSEYIRTESKNKTSTLKDFIEKNSGISPPTQSKQEVNISNHSIKTNNENDISIPIEINDIILRYDNKTDTNDITIISMPSIETTEISKTKSISSNKDFENINSKSSSKLIENDNNKNISYLDEIKSVNESFAVEKFSKIKNVNNKRDNIITNQINKARGDFNTNNFSLIEKDKEIINEANLSQDIHNLNNSTIGDEIWNAFSKCDNTIISQNYNLNDTKLSYSTIGMYEQLLQIEGTKTEYLTAFLKLREKSLLDRTRSQLSWLQIQKKKYKAKGLINQITAVRKKQRAILMKMEKEREEIKRLLKTPQSPLKKVNDNVIRKKSLPNIQEIILRHSPSPNNNNTKTIIKGIELEMNNTLEIMLKKREEELNKRRKHVEKLIDWHKRLDIEEDEVCQLEKFLYECNLNHDNKIYNTVDKRIKKLDEINKSIQELHSISSHDDIVRINGHKLNKLWRRLTGRNEELFNPIIKYKLNSIKLEEFYENAKKAVIEDFEKDNHLNILLEKSKNEQTTTSFNSNLNDNNEINIPILNLNLSTNTSQNDINSSCSNKTKETIFNIKENEKISSNIENNNQNSITDNKILDDIFNEASYQHFINEESNLINITQKSNSISSDSKLLNENDINNSVIKNHLSEEEVVDMMIINTAQLSNENKISSEIIASSEIISEELSQKVESLYTTLESIQLESKIENDTDNNIKSNDYNSDTFTDSYSNIDITNSKNNNTDKTIEQQSEKTFTIENSNMEKNTNINKIGELNDIHEIKIDINETILDDISSHILETFEETLNSDNNQKIDKFINNKQLENNEEIKNLEKCLIDLDVSLKESNGKFDNIIKSDDNNQIYTILDKTNESFDDEDKENKPISNICNQDNIIQNQIVSNDFLLNNENDNCLMPDIINEVELKRRQLFNENDIKHLENAVPYVFLREIPNKPPPPYVPPAHGSPMTTIFPSENRIKDITYRMIQELYNEINDPNLKQSHPSLLDENITNIYERIVLDICKENMKELLNPDNYIQPLAFYNPPNRLKCLQDYIYKRIRKFLLMDKTYQRQRFNFDIGLRKRDQIDELLIDELIEEDYKWCIFDKEEEEVIERGLDQILDDTNMENYSDNSQENENYENDSNRF